MLQFIKFKPDKIVRLNHQKSDQGFTLLEVLLVVFMISILAAMGIPSWIALLNNTRLKTARANVSGAIREAQTTAKQRKASFTVSFQQNGDSVQWAVHSGADPTNWQTIDVPSIQIDTENTTLGGNTASPWSITFDEKGQVVENPSGEVTAPSKITVSMQNNEGLKKCVIVQTILGAMTTEDGNKCAE